MKIKNLFKTFAFTLVLGSLLMMGCKKDTFQEKTGICPTTTEEYTLELSSNPENAGITTGDGIYEDSTLVTASAEANDTYEFTNWKEDGVVVSPNANYKFNMVADRTLVANFKESQHSSCFTVVDLGSAGYYVILTESGISSTGTTSVIGNMGINPAPATAITGFDLVVASNGEFSTSSLVIGDIYAPGYADPTPANLVTATDDMHTAYTIANGLVNPAPVTEFMAGNLNGQTLSPGIYKWSTGVTITDGITLDGEGDNCGTFIFQIEQDLTVAPGAAITLANGADARNIFWVIGGGAAIGTTVEFYGNVLGKTLITVGTGAEVTGRLLAQTAVTLDAATINKP